MDLLVSRAKDLQWRIIQGFSYCSLLPKLEVEGVNKDDAGFDSTYVRWREYQHEINLKPPFQMGFLAGATMSKGKPLQT